MLIRFTTRNGSPLYINPEHIISVCEDKHFGRPGFGKDTEYSDTRILTTKGDFNVQEAPQDVAAQVNSAASEAGDAAPAGTDEA